MDSDPNSYEYKAGVKDKVKEFESKLLSRSCTIERENAITEKSSPNSPKPPKKTSTATQIDEHSLAKNISTENKNHTDTKSKKSESVLTVKSIPSGRSSSEASTINQDSKNVNIGMQVVKSEHLSKPVKPQTIFDGKLSSSLATSPTKQHLPPKPAPRKLLSTQQSSGNESLEFHVAVNDSNSEASHPGPSPPATRRSSSEDDGIADMASESDPFDDFSMPLPKIRENAFILKDRRRSNEEDKDVEPNEGMIAGLPPLSPRRASLNPQSSVERNDRPRSLRGRTDSTNSAENYAVRQISTDEEGNRRESQAEVKINVLQSTGLSTQIDSWLRSPVVVKSKTLNNSSASILVLGFPQSGKSALIASLVQKPIAQENISNTKASKNSSREILEYTAKIKILDSSNLFNLKIIETPGFTNDPTITSDAQFMCSLVSYLESKDGLHGKTPTIVLVALCFDDKRLWNPEDEHPDIVNFLKLIHNFQQNLNDGKYANFVFVLTNFLGGSATVAERRRPQTKIVELINLIQKYTSLPHPIMVVCAENDPMNKKYESEKGSKPFAVALTNGETFPYNLIDKIKILLTKKGRDSVGETVLRTAFGIEYPYSIKECKVTQRIPLVSSSHSSVEQMRKTILHAYMDIERTEIFTLLEIGWENIDLKIRENFPESLFTVQQIFQTKKVCNFVDIPEDPSKVLNLVRQMPSNLAVKDLLIDTLQLKVPACYPALYIGQGFDLSKDTTTNVSPFQLTSGLKTSPVGLIPNEFDCKIRDDREIIFKFFHSVEEYVTQRLKDLNLLYSISENSLSALSTAVANSKVTHHRWGYNLIKGNQEVTKSTIATAAIEHRVFQISVNPSPELNFKQQFWGDVKNLPDLDIKNAATVSAWREFFGYWGTHVVKSGFGGGSVELTFRGSVLSKIYNSMKRDFILPSDEYETTKVFQWITGDGLDFVAACGKDVKNEFLQGYDVAANFHGGDIKFQQVDLTKLASKEELTGMREEWKESLVLNPVMLETNLVLVPLSYFVRAKSEGIATKIDVALHYFYSDFMVTQGKQSSCSIL